LAVRKFIWIEKSQQLNPVWAKDRGPLE
jgi:hypothetical protein